MSKINLVPVDVKCCGSCRELKQDDMTGHFYCGFEEDEDCPAVDFDPMEGEQWKYVCEYWADPGKRR